MSEPCNVSVLVPVYNVERYLRQCLDSLAAQTLVGIEIICIDDGSTDGSGAILDEYAARDARFRVVHKENSGYGASMNVGLRAARGKYIGIVESDDWADAEMFAALYEAAERGQAEAVRSNYWVMQDGVSTFQEELAGFSYGAPLRPRDLAPAILLRNPNIWSAIYRKAFLYENGIRFHETPGASFQDQSFSFEVLTSAERYVLVREAYLHYRVDNAGSSMHAKNKIFCIHDEYDEMERFLTAHGRPTQQHVWAARLLYQHILWNEPRMDPIYLGRYWTKAIERLCEAAQSGYFKHEMTEDPQGWLMRRMAKRQELPRMLRGWWAELADAPQVFLAGAGKVARKLLPIFSKHEIPVAGLLVSHVEENLPAIGSIPIYAMTDAVADRDQDVVVLAVSPDKPAVQQELLISLEQAGYRNIIMLTKELWQVLV